MASELVTPSTTEVEEVPGQTSCPNWELFLVFLHNFLIKHGSNKKPQPNDLHLIKVSLE